MRRRNQWSKSSEVAEGMFDMPLEPFKKAPVPVSSQPVASVSPLSRCEPELFIGMGPQLQQADGMAWASYWEFC
ncbi:hypothetical protein EDB80DRAFT_737247 [Ilyonectria destructans]|nr:hypothetical protein EDB80DRAFT_741234 [Ilyonectria destructans]KAH6981454.1 hypothetical protein EDB80DRAFT_737247 [Ilyonectria destructans]